MSIVTYKNNTEIEEIKSVVPSSKNDSKQTKIAFGGKETTVEVKNPPPIKGNRIEGDEKIAESTIKSITAFILKRESHSYNEKELLELGIFPLTSSQVKRVQEIIQSDPFIQIVDNKLNYNPLTNCTNITKEVTFEIHDREFIALLDESKLKFMQQSGILETQALYVSKLAWFAIGRYKIILEREEALKNNKKSCILV